jgi:nicotinate-nucleotide pyrophosphorylase (carboxylating)
MCDRPGVLCAAVFEYLGCTVEWLLAEGDVIAPICEVAKVTGPVNRLLLGERTALNIMARASGVATLAQSACAQARAAGWHGQVVGTRKTTPGEGS